MACSRGWGVALALAVTIIVIAPSVALAFPAEPESLDEGFEGMPRHEKRFQLLPELGFFRGSLEAADGTVVSPMVEFRLQLAEHFILQAVWGGVYINLDQAENDAAPTNTFRSGSPFVAVHYQGVKGEFSYRFGLGVTVPIATLPDNLNSRVTAQTAYTFAAAIRGNWNFWIWNPHTVSIIVPMRMERRRASGFIWGVEFDAGAMISINEKNTFSDGAVIQMGGTMGYEVTPWFRTGANFTLVILPSFEGQKTQLAVEPYFRFGGENQFGVAKLLINIDRPHGFAFDDNGVWGLNLGGGFAF